MQKSLILIIIMLLSLTLYGQDTNDEWRATWVITWNYIGGEFTVEENKATIRDILDNHKAANMNAVLWQARQSGTAYYNSSFEPWGSHAGGSYPGFDPLEYAVEQAHLRGMELHAWFNAFHASSTVSGAPAAEHPDWVCRDGNGTLMPGSRALSPGLEEVRDYTLNVAMEIVNNYDIDGLHLDYIRWNEYTTSYFTSALGKRAMDEDHALDGESQVMESSTAASPDPNRYLYDLEHPYSGGVPVGYASWEDYWRDSVTDFVITLHDSIQAVKPWVRLSPAALGNYDWNSGWDGYNRVYQDAALWFNEGYIDQLTPMHYHWTNSLTFNDAMRKWGEKLGPGIATGNMFTAGPGSYMFENYGVWNNHPSVVNGVRKYNWIDGFQFFSMKWWEGRDYWDYAGRTFFARKTKVRDTGRIVSATPSAPSIGLAHIGPLNIQLTVTPPGDITENQWFAIYRNAVDTIDQDQSTIIDIHFGTTEFTVNDIFDGDQDHSSEYYYAATRLDRYWNESPSTATVISNALPSSAPRIMAFSPQDGNTVGVKEVIDIQFSKTMDVAAVEAAIQFTPSVTIGEFKWLSNDHRLQLYVDGHFDYGVDHTITIANTALDINGVALDGNGDGTPGDAYTSTFRTYDVDAIAPQLVNSLPNLLVNNDSIDIHENFSFEFDELIDPMTVNNTNVTFWSGGTQLFTDPAHSANETRSIIDVRTFQELSPGTSYEIHFGEGITDTSGNAFAGYVYGPFQTQFRDYSENKLIDDFIGTLGTWEHPNYSGTTAGVKSPKAATVFEYTNAVYLPASYEYASRKKSAYLRYYWDPDYDGVDGAYMIREYLAGGTSRSTYFDNSYILQCFVYGDNSNNLLRIAMDEKIGLTWPNHEVTTWVTVNWEGWRLLEWDLADPNNVGTWIGNEILDGSSYRIDSFQLTYDPAIGDSSGVIYFDDLRVVKKISTVATDEDISHQLPTDIKLYQNYPNPFNPETRISFSLPSSMQAKLSVYDIRGREVVTLADEELAAGMHELSFDGSDLTAGVYLLRLDTEQGSEVRRMLLLK